MGFETNNITNDYSLASKSEFCSDLTTTANETNGYTLLLSTEQQNVLDDLKRQLCLEDLMYLNKHKEVEAIANLILQEILENTPRDVRAHVARFLRSPRIADRVANLVSSENRSFSDQLYPVNSDEFLSMAGAAIISMNQQTDGLVADEQDKTTVRRDNQEN